MYRVMVTAGPLLIYIECTSDGGRMWSSNVLLRFLYYAPKYWWLTVPDLRPAINNLIQSCGARIYLIRYISANNILIQPCTACMNTMYVCVKWYKWITTICCAVLWRLYVDEATHTYTHSGAHLDRMINVHRY